MKDLRIRIYKSGPFYTYELMQVGNASVFLGGRVKVMDYTGRLFYMNSKGGINFTYPKTKSRND